jgi:hypothetical protein
MTPAEAELELAEAEAAASGPQEPQGERPPGFVGSIAPGETPEAAAQRLGGTYIPPEEVAKREGEHGRLATRGLRAAGLGVASGVTGGLSDELAGTIKATVAAGARMGLDLASTGAGKALLRRVGGIPDSVPDSYLDTMISGVEAKTAETIGAELRPGLADTFGATYRRGRDEVRAADEASAAESPWAHGIGSVLGSLVLPVAKAGQVLGKGIALSRNGARAATGLGQGALIGLGNSKADLAGGDIGGAALDTAVGGGLGAATSLGLGALGDAGGRALRRLAEDNALRALGLRAGIGNKLKSMGIKTGDEGRQELARGALDHGLIPWGSTPEGVGRNVAELMPFVGEAKGQVIQDAQAVATAAGRKVDFTGAADAAQRAVFDGADEIAIAKGGQARNLIDLIRKQGQTATTDNSLVMLDELKQSAQNNIRPLATKLAAQQQNKVAGILREQVENQTEALAGPEYSDALKGLNHKFSLMKRIEELTSDESTRAIGRQGALGMAVGAAAGGTGGALAGQMAQRYLLPRTHSAFAVMQDFSSKRIAPAVASPAAATMATKSAVEWFAEKFGRRPETKSDLAGSAFVSGQVGGQ